VKVGKGVWEGTAVQIAWVCWMAEIISSWDGWQETENIPTKINPQIFFIVYISNKGAVEASALVITRCSSPPVYIGIPGGAINIQIIADQRNPSLLDRGFVKQFFILSYYFMPFFLLLYF